MKSENANNTTLNHKNIPEEWKKVKLGEGVTSNKNNIGKDYLYPVILYLDTGSITEGKIEGFQKYELNNVPSRAKRLVKEKDIIYSTVRPIQRHYGFIINPPKNLVVSTGFSVIETNQDKAEPKFIYYLLTSNEIVETLDVIADGSTSAYPSLKPSDIENLEIFLPPLLEQKAIASVLYSLDDKIDLLHRQNKTLETIVETLFRQWFVEEAKEDWEEVPLGNIATVQNGYAFSSRDYVEYQIDHLEVFKMGHIEPGGGLRYSPKTDFVPRAEKLKKWILSKCDIVMAMTDMKDSMGILGHPAMIDISDTYVLNQRVARIYLNSNKSLINNHFLYLQLKTDAAIAIIQSKAHGGVQVNLSTEAIRSTHIIVPPEQDQEKGFKLIEGYLLKSKNNRKQIRILEKLRDTLLPKLMSGEVWVQYDKETTI